MAIFANGAATQTATVTNSATLVFDTDATGIPTSPAVTLKDATVVNTGAVTIYLGQSGVTATTGIALQPGAQLTFNGYSYLSTSTAGDIYAITSSGSSTTLSGLASVTSND